MRAVALAVLGGWVCLATTGACLVRRPRLDRPAPTAAHETRRSQHPDGGPRSEVRLLVWSDGRVERDGPEREYHANGALQAERFFEHDVPTGLWRTWHADETPRSEVDFGAPGSSEPHPNRFWHANGRLAAEGQAIAGVRVGEWSYWSESGVLLRTGGYRDGRREGPWRFFSEDGLPRAEGRYALGTRVGAWTLWDEHGLAHTRPAATIARDFEGDAQPR